MEAAKPESNQATPQDEGSDVDMSYEEYLIY